METKEKKSTTRRVKKEVSKTPKVEEVKETEQPIQDDEEFEVVLKKYTCPECGTTVEMAEGCFICLNCGYSGCS